MASENSKESNDPPPFVKGLKTFSSVLAGVFAIATLIQIFLPDTDKVRITASVCFICYIAAFVITLRDTKTSAPVRKLFWGITIIGVPLFFLWAGTWFAAAPLEIGAYPVERSSYNIYPFSGSSEGQGNSGTSYLTITNTYNGRRSITGFLLDYTLSEELSYTGWAFRFTNAFDMSAFNAIKLIVSFKDPSSRVEVILRDGTVTSRPVLLGDGQFGDAAIKNEQEVSIPLSEFRDITLNIIREMVFSCRGAVTRGKGTIEIRDIRFSR